MIVIMIVIHSLIEVPTSCISYMFHSLVAKGVVALHHFGIDQYETGAKIDAVWIGCPTFSFISFT